MCIGPKISRLQTLASVVPTSNRGTGDFTEVNLETLRDTASLLFGRLRNLQLRVSFSSRFSECSRETPSAFFEDKGFFLAPRGELTTGYLGIRRLSFHARRNRNTWAFVCRWIRSVVQIYRNFHFTSRDHLSALLLVFSVPSSSSCSFSNPVAIKRISLVRGRRTLADFVLLGFVISQSGRRRQN